MTDCPFCRMVSGEIPVKKVFENDYFLAILDIYPANPGHILLLSKQHHSSFSEFSDDSSAIAGVIGKKLSENLIRALSPLALSLFIADGAPAGQRAPHTLIHIIPRFPGDALPLDPEGKVVDPDGYYPKIKDAFSNIFPGFAERRPEPKPTAPQPKEAPEVKIGKTSEKTAKKDDKEEGLSLDEVAALFRK